MLKPRSIIVFVTCSFTLLTAMPGLAGTQYTSKDGNLTVQYGNKCSTTKPSCSYRDRNGAAGNLTAIDCSGMGGDSARIPIAAISRESSAPVQSPVDNNAFMRNPYEQRQPGTTEF